MRRKQDSYTNLCIGLLPQEKQIYQYGWQSNLGNLCIPIRVTLLSKYFSLIYFFLFCVEYKKIGSRGHKLIIARDNVCFGFLPQELQKGQIYTIHVDMINLATNPKLSTLPHVEDGCGVRMGALYRCSLWWMLIFPLIIVGHIYFHKIDNGAFKS